MAFWSSKWGQRGHETFARKVRYSRLTETDGPEGPSSGRVLDNCNDSEQDPQQVNETESNIKRRDALEVEVPDPWSKRRLIARVVVLGLLIGGATTTAVVWNTRRLHANSSRSSKHVSKAPVRAGPSQPKVKKVQHRNCMAHSEFHCLLDPGCRWFSHLGSSGTGGSNCPHCEKWFGPSHASVTGCRDWDPKMYCHEMIFVVAVRWKDSDPRAPWFSDALGQYHVAQSGMDPRTSPRKRLVCDVWCDGPEPGRCYGQPRVVRGSMHGVNYGGRFIPEQILRLPGTDELLFKGIAQPGVRKRLSLCDVNTPDASIRMTKFLDLNIKEEHFALMAKLGFRILRLPLGYWNVIEVPGGGTPRGPPDDVLRWRALQSILPVAKYRKWIDMVFAFATKYGLKVLMVLHGAPGGQSGSQKTGCGFGKYSTYHFPSVPAGVGWNTMLGVFAIEAIARICAQKDETCYGIELLNEPFDPGLGRHTRHRLQSFYHRAIRSARKHLDKGKPLVIFEWSARLWYWRHRRNWFTHEDYGRIMFSTQLFMYLNRPTVTQKTARDSLIGGINAISEFALHTGYDVLITEYALHSHRDGKKDDHFDYNSLTDWFIHQFEQFAMGSMVWNFDSFFPAWGPVAEAQVGSGKPVEWQEILKDRCRWEKSNCTQEPWQLDDVTT